MELPCLGEFLNSVVVEKSGSLHTRQSYARDLALFTEFLTTTRSDIDHFSQQKLQTFCTARKLGRRSQARVISTLRSYFKYLQRQGRIKELPKLEIIQHVRALPETLSAAEVQKLFAASQESEKNGDRARRNRAVLVLLFGTGCRVSELCAADLGDLQTDMRVLRICGKGSKERLVPLVTEAIEALNDYLSVRLNLADPTEKSLIVNDRGHRPSRIDIFRWLKKWSKAAGLNKTVSPHKLRHACATELLRQGVDLRSIQVLLGHASIATTEIYTKVENADLDEAVRKFHPLSGSRS